MDADILLQSLLDLSEQAANLARLIREDKELFKLLIASKDQRLSGEPDFKTLADVLIQSTFRYGLHKQFPQHNIDVRGEEDGTFPTKDGPVSLSLTDDIAQTRQMLSKVLTDSEIVSKLCTAIHGTVRVPDAQVSKCRGIKLPKELSVWIDPIDSTSSYISGTKTLESVTILVGVHHAGVPILGVMTYPFTKEQIWGLCVAKHKICNIPVPTIMANSVVLSSMESQSVIDKLHSIGYQTAKLKGAGYKLGCVIKGEAVVYCVSLKSTYQWDTCGPHAILRSLGGDVVVLSRPSQSLIYNQDTAPNPGFIAYISRPALEKFLKVL